MKKIESKDETKRLIGQNFFRGMDGRDQDERDLGLNELKKQIFKDQNKTNDREYINEIPEHLSKPAGFNYEVKE